MSDIDKKQELAEQFTVFVEAVARERYADVVAERGLFAGFMMVMTSNEDRQEAIQRFKEWQEKGQ